MLPNIRLLHFSWFPLHFQVALGQCHLYHPHSLHRLTWMQSDPPYPFVFPRSSASGSASHVLCS